MQLKSNCCICNELGSCADWFGNKKQSVTLCKTHNKLWRQDSKKTLTKWWLDKYGNLTNTIEHNCKKQFGYPYLNVPNNELNLAFAEFLTKTLSKIQVQNERLSKSPR